MCLTRVHLHRIQVKSICPEGERLCIDLVSCSSVGVCLEDLDISFEKNLREAQIDHAPVISLVHHDLLPQFLDIPRFSAFESCTQGQLPMENKLCDLGAVAIDEEDGDITASVLACPPENCLDQGCPQHKFSVKGVKGCVNTSAPVGSEFSLRYLVFDGAIPANNASVVRVVTIASPCARGEHFCESDAACSSVECDVRDALSSQFSLKTDRSEPKITFNASFPEYQGGFLTLSYGVPAPVALSADSLAARPGTPAVFGAWDDNDGDLTMAVTTQQSRTNSKDPACAVAALEAGVCSPGYYTYLFSVEDAAGNVDNRWLLVRLVQRAQVAFQMIMPLGPEVITYHDAAAAAESLLTPNSTRSLAIREGVAALVNENMRSEAPAELISAVSEVTRPDYVRVANATVLEPGVADGIENATAFSLVVDCVVQVVTASSLPPQKRLGRRRALQTGEGEGESAVSALASSVASLIHEATTAAADSDSSDEKDGLSLSAYVTQSAETRNITDVIAVESLGSEVSTALVTKTVDDAEVLLADLHSEVTNLRALQDLMLVEAAALLVSTDETNDSSSLLRTAVEDSWLAGMTKNLQDATEMSEGLTESLNLLAELQVTAPVIDMDSIAEITTAQKVAQGQFLDILQLMMNASASLTSIANRTLATEELVDDNVMCSERENGETSIYFTAQYSEAAPPPPWTSPPDVSVSVAVVGAGSTAASGRRQLLRASSAAGGIAQSKQATLGTTTTYYLGYTPVVRDAPVDTRVPSWNAKQQMARHNIILGGMMIEQHRQGPGRCTRRFSGMGAPCNSGGSTLTQGYGTDPVFRMHTELYRADMVGQEGEYYSVEGDGAGARDAPYTLFHRRPVAGGSAEPGYPVFIDAAVTGGRAWQMHLMMLEGHYIDRSTNRIEVSVVTFNPNTRTMGILDIQFKRSAGGSFHIVSNVMSIPMPQNHLAVRDLDALEVVQRVLLVLWVGLVCYLCCKTMHARGKAAGEKVTEVLETGGTLRFAEAAWVLVRSLVIPDDDSDDFWEHILQSVALWGQFVGIVALLAYVYIFYVYTLESAASYYSIYDEPYGRANFIMPKKRNPTVNEPDVNRWELEDDERPMQNYAATLNAVHMMSSVFSFFWLSQALVVFALLFLVGYQAKCTTQHTRGHQMTPNASFVLMSKTSIA